MLVLSCFLLNFSFSFLRVVALSVSPLAVSSRDASPYAKDNLNLFAQLSHLIDAVLATHQNTAPANTRLLT